MKHKGVLAALLLLVASSQTAWGQGFRVYKSDGTVAQYSLRTDSIVFYDGIGTDEDFGPFTPVNQYIAGMWYKSEYETVTFGEDGTTDYVAGSTYEFLPYQGTVIIYSGSGAPVSYFRVLKSTAEQLIVSETDSSLHVWSKSPISHDSENGHEYVDLGLPSGTKWATCNVGANSPMEYGNYFAWGETKPKSIYSEGTYDPKGDGLGRYDYIGDDIAGTKYDAATSGWGEPWHMPTLEQVEELCGFCSRQWTQYNGVNGILVTGPNGNTIFLPAAGIQESDGLNFLGSEGCYWSSSFGPEDEYESYGLDFYSFRWDIDYHDRERGRSVRPVCP